MFQKTEGNSNEVRFEVRSIAELSELIISLASGGWKDQWDGKKMIIKTGDRYATATLVDNQTTTVDVDFAQEAIKAYDGVASVIIIEMFERGDLVTTAFIKENKRVVLQWKIDE